MLGKHAERRNSQAPLKNLHSIGGISRQSIRRGPKPPRTSSGEMFCAANSRRDASLTLTEPAVTQPSSGSNQPFTAPRYSIQPPRGNTEHAPKRRQDSD